MKLRYRKFNTFFIPQYTLGDKWINFDTTLVSGELKRICEQLGDLQLPSKWGEGQWFFASRLNPENKNILFFTKEIYVNAFLGAAFSFFDNTTKEYTPCQEASNT